MSSARTLVVAMSAAGLGLAGFASADEVVLKTGGRLSGVIVERTADRVAIETGPGRVTLPMSRVERIVAAPSALAGFRERAAAVAPTDAAGWADLARWAEEHELPTQAREAWQRVLDLQPGHPQANAALGRVQIDGRWLDSDDAYRAQGYVQYDGRWVTPAEHEALLRERAAEDAERREAAEVQARVREAEARAAEAEARAREAEAAAQPTEGIPYGWWGYGGGIFPPPGVEPTPGHGNRPPHPRRPPATTAPGRSRGQTTSTGQTTTGQTTSSRPSHAGIPAPSARRDPKP